MLNTFFLILSKGVESEAIQSVLDLCFKLDPESRPDCDRLKRYLGDFSECRVKVEVTQRSSVDVVDEKVQNNAANDDSDSSESHSGKQE